MSGPAVHQGGFQVDRTLTIALVFTVFVQTAAAFVWTGSAMHRLTTLEAETATNREVLVRLARIEEQIAALRRDLEREAES